MTVIRDALLERAVAAFEREGATAVHLFGSLARGDGDHLSDIDLWITIPDHKIHDLVARRFEIFGGVADVLIHHEAPRNRPLGGSYTLVIHRTDDALIQCDYYLAPESTSILLPEARHLSGSQALPRGPWVLDINAEVTEDQSERIDFLICMSFIGIKKMIRGDDEFIAFLDREYERFWSSFGKSVRLVSEVESREVTDRGLESLIRSGTARQRTAAAAIRHYAWSTSLSSSSTCQT